MPQCAAEVDIAVDEADGHAAARERRRLGHAVLRELHRLRLAGAAVDAHAPRIRPDFDVVERALEPPRRRVEDGEVVGIEESVHDGGRRCATCGRVGIDARAVEVRPRAEPARQRLHEEVEEERAEWVTLRDARLDAERLRRGAIDAYLHLAHLAPRAQQLDEAGRDAHLGEGEPHRLGVHAVVRLVEVDKEDGCRAAVACARLERLEERHHVILGAAAVLEADLLRPDEPVPLRPVREPRREERRQDLWHEVLHRDAAVERRVGTVPLALVQRNEHRLGKARVHAVAQRLVDRVGDRVRHSAAVLPRLVVVPPLRPSDELGAEAVDAGGGRRVDARAPVERVRAQRRVLCAAVGKLATALAVGAALDEGERQVARRARRREEGEVDPRPVERRVERRRALVRLVGSRHELRPGRAVGRCRSGHRCWRRRLAGEETAEVVCKRRRRWHAIAVRDARLALLQDRVVARDGGAQRREEAVRVARADMAHTLVAQDCTLTHTCACDPERALLEPGGFAQHGGWVTRGVGRLGRLAASGGDAAAPARSLRRLMHRARRLAQRARDFE